MKTMIKYELKKILQNKITILFMIIALFGTIVFSAVMVREYRTGIRGFDEKVMDDHSILKNTFVSSGTIDTLCEQLNVFEEDDSHYEKLDDKYSSTLYRGKYDYTKSLMNKYEENEIPEEELVKADNGWKENPLVIKESLLPEYIGMLAPVSEYRKVEKILDFYENIDEPVEEDEALIYSQYAKDAQKVLSEGFAYGYNYGWISIVECMGSGAIFLALSLIFGLCNIFTGEYSTNMDALIISAKNGKNKVIMSKFISAAIFSLICSMIFIAINIIVHLLFLGTEGAFSTYSTTEFFFGKTVSCIEALVISCIILIVSGIVISLLTVAVSALNAKLIASIAITIILTLFSVLFEYIRISSNNSVFNALINSAPYAALQNIRYDSMSYFTLGDCVYDSRLLYIPVFILISITAIIIIFTAFRRHKVKN